MTKIVSTFLLATLLATSAQAQEAPAPRRMPRVPVSRESLVQQHDQMPASREVQGLAAILDGEKLRIGETDLRLFGIVPPQLAASFGPQARTQLDTLANGQNVACQIRDRDRDGRLLATCRNANGVDMALDLLKHGLAVTARGSLSGTEFAAPYAAAEQAAQGQRIGLWSVVTTAAAIPAPQAAPKVEVKAEAKPEPVAAEPEAKKEEKPAARAIPTPPVAETQTQAKIAADILGQQAQAHIDEEAWSSGNQEGFFERYQILIAGLLMLSTALSIIGALWAQKTRDRRDETKAVAAALRGELMAARSVCIGRARTITGEAEDRTAIWPRIRSTLYQAYVGRLGLLGAELARQVASIYGQSSDYAALYNPTAPAVTQEIPKKQALEALSRRIDEILPRLAEIERTGCLPSSSWVQAPHTHQSTSAGPISTPYSPAEQAAASILTETTHAPAPIPLHPGAMRTTLAVWESVRNFIVSHSPTTATETQPPAPVDPQVAEYAALIEADMARYQYGDNVETLDITPHKKRG